MLLDPNNRTRTVADIFGHRTRAGELFGLELEVELVSPDSAQAVPGFTTHSEPSLHNGIEYVTDPVNREQLEKNLVLFVKTMKEHTRQSPRSGVHIHINCLQETPQSLSRIVGLYALLERDLISSTYPERLGNVFARLISTQRQPFYRELARGYDVQNQRYLSLNPAPLPRFGTMEVRFLGGQLDATRILNTLDMIRHIFSVAKEGTNEELISRMSDFEGWVKPNFPYATRVNYQKSLNPALALLNNSFRGYVNRRGREIPPEQDGGREEAPYSYSGIEIDRTVRGAPRPTRGVPTNFPVGLRSSFDIDDLRGHGVLGVLIGNMYGFYFDEVHNRFEYDTNLALTQARSFPGFMVSGAVEALGGAPIFPEVSRVAFFNFTNQL